MLNATEMSKPFGKKPAKWLALPSTKEFLTTLSDVRKSDFAMVQTDKGGVSGGGGTWMHEDVALEFARWLSPAFAIWCNDRIKEILTTGVATITNDDEAIAYAMEVLNRRLAESKQRVQMLESENAAITEERDKLLPKAQYTDEVLQSGSTYTFTQVAHDLGMRSVHALLSELFRRKVLLRQSGQIQPTAKVADKGYFKTRTAKFFHSDGSVGTTLSTVVTESGRVYLHSLLNGKGGAPCLR